MKEGEIYDSELLRTTINTLISKGKRNFSIDFSSLDYIYSDTINVLLAINKRILDVSGRLSILAPGVEVRNILNRAGIQNILKIYDNEFDLLHSSEDIIKQTQTISLSEVKGYLNKDKPKSDFAAFQSEINEAITQKTSDVPVMPAQPAAPQPFMDLPPARKAPAAPVPPPPAQRPNVPASSEEYVFESPQAAPAQPTFEPPRRPAARAPQPAPQPQQDNFPTFELPTQASAPVRPAATPPPSRPAPMPQAPAAQGPKSRFEPEPNTWEDEEDLAEKPKSFPVMPFVLGAILVILVAGLVTVVLLFTNKKPQETAQEITAPVQLPVQPAPSATVPPAPAAAPQVTPAPAPAPAEKQPIVSDEVAPPPARAPERQARAPRAPVAPAPRPARSQPPAIAAPAPPPAAPKTANRLTVTSSPSGASVKIDGKLMGITPYTLNNPAVLGAMEISLSKPGYEENSKFIDFQGGTQKEFFILEKAAPPPPPAPVTREAEIPPPAAPAPAPQAAIPAPAPAPAPTPAPSAATPKGEPGTIFIASNPPMADVYIDGKLIGKTNINKLNIFSGTHTMRFEKNGKELTKEMTFNAGDNPPQFITIK